MFCTKCGAQNADGSVMCAQCGATLSGAAGASPPPPPPPPGVPPAPPGGAYQAGSAPPPARPPGQYGAGPAGPPGQYGAMPEVPNYLVWAILTTIFCCLPAGIASIVFAAQVNGKLAVGDYAGAVESSNNAKLWAKIAFGVGVAWILVVVGINVVSIFFAAASGGFQP